MNIIRKRLAASEIAPTDQRYNPDCDCVQYTPDSGATWIDAPQFDPRTSQGFARPPFPSSDPQCDAAASIVANMKAGLDKSLEEIAAVSSGATAISAILALLSFIDGIGLLIALITDFVLSIVTIGVAAVDAAFTTDVYDALKCIFDCNCQSDGSFSQDNFDAIAAAVSTQFGEFSTVNIVTQGWLKFLGPVGLTNVASAQHITGDCSDCLCCPPGTDWCATVLDPTVDTGGECWDVVVHSDWPGTIWAAYAFDTVNDKWAWEQQTVSRGSGVEVARVLNITRTFPTATYTHVEIDLGIGFGTFTTDIRQGEIILNGSVVQDYTSAFTGTFVWDGSITGTLTIEIAFILSYRNDSTDGGGGGRIFRVELAGTGTAPDVSCP